MSVRNLKVIVVEDDEVLCGLFASELDKDPFIKTAQAHDLPEAVRLCQLEPQVVLLVDLTIPGAKGMEAVSETRQAAPGATIIVITGNLDADQAALDAGATTVIHKGTRESYGEPLRKAVRDAVSLHEMQLLYRPVRQTIAEVKNVTNKIEGKT